MEQKGIMIRLAGKEDCCGCSACVERCPKQCISFSEDKEGFFYPSVDVGSCIDCGVYESVCPFAHPAGTRLPLKVLAAKNIDETVRLASSSGGIFTYLATQIINQRGVVFGAQFNDEWLVDIGYSETIDGLSGFRGSKYLQANVGDSFTICEDFLKSGRKVLFSGTPCQIAGLKKFLREDYGNLITIETTFNEAVTSNPSVISSPTTKKIRELFFRELVPLPKRFHTFAHLVKSGLKHNKKKVMVAHFPDTAVPKGISFRSKANGWKEYEMKIDF